jgi:hypothetical protein
MKVLGALLVMVTLEYQTGYFAAQSAVDCTVARRCQILYFKEIILDYFFGEQEYQD